MAGKQIMSYDKNLSLREFKLFQELMYSYAGICLGDQKHSLVQNRLRKRLNDLALPSYQEYFNYISETCHKDEFQNCINALTTNETFFFRHKNHWDFLVNMILPAWKKKSPCTAKFRAWSAASSTGEEPYSLAIILYDILQKDDSRYRIEIEATDINQDVLKQAKEAVYGEYSLQKLSKLCLKKYFRVVPETNLFTVCREVAKLVDFKMHNLQTRFNTEMFDIIFLRNVMIYFDEKSKKKVMEHVTSVLRPGGYLFLGGAETIAGCCDEYSYVRPTVYRKNDHVK